MYYLRCLFKDFLLSIGTGVWPSARTLLCINWNMYRDCSLTQALNARCGVSETELGPRTAQTEEERQACLQSRHDSLCQMRLPVGHS